MAKGDPISQKQHLALAIVLAITCFCFLLLCEGCRSALHNRPINPVDYEPEKGRPKSSQTYQRDSLYLHYTAEVWKQKGWQYFSSLHKFPVPLEKVPLWIDSILYSPDSSKLMAFLVYRVPTTSELADSKGRDFAYFGTVLIAFRDKLPQPWRVYEFTQFTPAGWTTYKQVHELFRRYYLGNGRFREAGQYVLDYKGEWVAENFAYNLDQPEFWTKSVVWRKGARIPGYYNFQIKGNYGPEDIETAIVPYLEIDYPKQILDMYK